MNYPQQTQNQQPFLTPRLPPQAGEGGGNPIMTGQEYYRRSRLNPGYQPPPDQRGGVYGSTPEGYGRSYGPRMGGDRLYSSADDPNYDRARSGVPSWGVGGNVGMPPQGESIGALPYRPGAQRRSYMYDMPYQRPAAPEGLNASTLAQARNAGASPADMARIFRGVPTNAGDHGMAQRQALQQWRQTSPNYRGPINPHAHQAVPGQAQDYGNYSVGRYQPPSPVNNTGIAVQPRYGLGNTMGGTGAPYTPPSNPGAAPPAPQGQPGLSVTRTRPAPPIPSTNDPRNRPPIGTGVTQGPRNIY